MLRAPFHESKKRLVTDELVLWEIIKPLLYHLKRPGPKEDKASRVADRAAALTAIVFVLKSGAASLGRCCPRRRWTAAAAPPAGATLTRDWQGPGGVWREELHRVLLDRLAQADEIDWERASLDYSASVVAAKGGRANRPESDG